MSRSKKKHCKMQIAYGNDTWWFKDRRRNTRHKNKHMLRNLLANKTLDVLADLIISLQNKHNKSYDDWCKPSDGTYLCFDKDNQYYERNIRK